MNYEVLINSITFIIGGFTFCFGIFQYWQMRRFEKYLKFIELREKFKGHPSNDRILRHIQAYQLDNTKISNLDDFNITIHDFYYFLGFYEELQILIDKGILNKNVSKKMFSFYAIEIKNNNYYWARFDENIDDPNWYDFKIFVESMENE